MNDNTTILLAQIIAGVASVFGVWYMNHAQNKRDEKKREQEEAAATKKKEEDAQKAVRAEITERARLRAELEDSAQKFINDTFEDMRFRIASLEDELERQAGKYETQINKLTNSYEAKLQEQANHYEAKLKEQAKRDEAQMASLKASVAELTHSLDKLQGEVKQEREMRQAVEKENGRLQAENHQLKSGKGKMGL